MATDWESWLKTASGPASATEEQERDRTEERIRRAINAAADIPNSVRTYAKGSYANNTNVRRDADVDIAVEWTETFKVGQWGKTLGMSAAELGYNPVNSPIEAQEYRRRVEQALITAFGSGTVDTSPDKCIGVEAGTGTLEADVVPCFTLHRYDAPYDWRAGHRIFPKSGSHVDNFPRQNYDNGVAKNKATSTRYKQIVRCFKRLEGLLLDEGEIPRDYPGYLIECLVYNVPNDCFGGDRRYDDMQDVFRFLWSGLKNKETYETWTEPSGLWMLFRGRPNRSPKNAAALVGKAWLRIGVVE